MAATFFVLYTSWPHVISTLTFILRGSNSVFAFTVLSTDHLVCTEFPFKSLHMFDNKRLYLVNRRWWNNEI